MPNRKLDALDRKILNALQKNARLSNVELAKNLSQVAGDGELTDPQRDGNRLVWEPRPH